MRCHYLLLVGLLAGLASIASANPVDPDISIDDGCCSIPLATNADLAVVQPNNSGFQTFDFENDTGHYIDSFTFSAFFVGGLTTDEQAAYNCPGGTQHGSGGPFFLFCDVTTTSNTVTYFFHGVNPEDPSTDAPTDSEVGEQEGIPVADGTLIKDPVRSPEVCGGVEEPSCVYVGHFSITLREWDDTDAPGAGNASFTNSFTTIPEPGLGTLLAPALLLIAGFGKRYARRRA